METPLDLQSDYEPRTALDAKSGVPRPYGGWYWAAGRAICVWSLRLPAYIVRREMRYDDDVHRRSIRLPCWDYREQGAYFVTICTHGRGL